MFFFQKSSQFSFLVFNTPFKMSVDYVSVLDDFERTEPFCLLLIFS